MTIKPNSPWLSNLPTRDVIHRGERIRRRLGRAFVLAVILVPIILASLVIWQQALPENGPARLLYAFHDHIYLPAMGWLVTRFYPWSLIVWGTVATLIMLWLASWYLDRSFIKRPHITVLRMTLARPLFYPVLVRTITGLRSVRVSSQMVEIVANREWDNAWGAIARQPQKKTSPQACQHLANLTLFQLMLLNRRDGEVVNWLKALELWLEAWVTILTAARNDMSGFRTPLQTLLKAAYLVHIEDLERLPTLPQESAALAPTDGFDAGVMAREQLAAMRWAMSHWQKEASSVNDEAVSILSSGVERRRRLISVAAAMYERRLSLSGTPDVNDRPPMPESAPETLAIAGRVARLLALQAALISDSPVLALGYEDALRSLRLLLAVAPVASQATPRWRELLDGSPEADLRQSLFWDWSGPNLLAVLIKAQHNETMQREWAAFQQIDSHLVDLNARDLAAAQVATVRLTAGPITAPGNWNAGSRTRDERSRREFDNRVLRLPLRRRMDLALGAFLTVGFSAIIATWLVGITTANRAGMFDPPLVQPLADKRILTNVRDDLVSKRLLDSTFHSDQHLYISQEGGAIHRYQPSTDLWSLERPFAAEQPISDRFVLLRSGCGDEGFGGTCTDPRSLWALGDDGSLARRINGRWELVVSNSVFIGVRGIPVEHAGVTAAAVSNDGRWLLLGTQEDGFGIYDTIGRRWLPGAAQASASLPALAVEQAIWWQGYFWLSGEKGVVRVGLNVRNNDIMLEPIAGMENRVLDLDADAEGALWVLDERPCLEDGSTCLWLGRLTSPDIDPETVIDQRNSYPGLSLNDLQYAQQVDDRLVLAGKAGIFTYDLTAHAWARILAQDVSAVLPLADGRGFYFAAPQLLGLVHNAMLTITWTLPDEPVLQLSATDDEVLIFTQASSLYRLASGATEVELIRADDGTAIDPALIQTAASFGDVVMMTSPEGALLHNTRTRTYDDVPLDAIPDWLTDSGSSVITNADETFVIPGGEGKSAIHIIETARIGDPTYFTGGWVNKAPAISVAAPVSSVWPLSGQGIGLLDAEGNVYQIKDTKKAQITGNAQPNLANKTLQDVAAKGRALVFLVSGDLW